jgi:PilZ domain
MNLAPTFLELRKHPRAQLRFPARVRWRGPLGMRMESTHTLDVSRNGIRVHRNESCETGSRVWVVFPFEVSSAAAGVPPETPARVVRVESGRGAGYQVSLELELPSRDAARPADRERRACSRISFALPIFVRALGFPWPEESMTQNISRAGARFESAHIYSAGDAVLAKIPWGDWARAGEIPARIVRVENSASASSAAPLSDPLAGTSAILTSVAVRWDAPRKA